MKNFSLLDLFEEPANSHFIIGAYHDPPVLKIHRAIMNYTNATAHYSGIFKDILVYLSEALGFTYEFIDVFANYVNKSTGPSEVFLQLMKHKIDITARIMVLTPDRFAMIDFPSPLIIGPIVILQPFPQWKNEFNAIFQPFSPKVWAVLLITFLLTTIFLTLTVTISRKNEFCIYKKTIKTTIGDMSVYIFSIFTSQGGDLGDNWIPTYLIAGSCCLTAVVIVNGYNSTLTSFLSIRSFKPIVHNWDDLAKARHLKLVVERNSVVEDIIMKSNTDAMAQLAEYLRQNPRHRFSSFEEFSSLTKDGMFALPLQKLAAQGRVFHAMRFNKGECTLTFGSPSRTYTTLHSIGMRKGFPWKDAINKALLLMTDVGIIERMKVNYIGIADKCTMEKLSRNLRNNAHLRPLRLSSFHGLFIILSLGYGIAILTFIVELAVGFTSKRRKPVRNAEDYFLRSRRRRGLRNHLI